MKDDIPYIVISTPVLLIGGTEFQMLSLVKALISCNYKVGVLCYYEFNDSVVERFVQEGAEVTLLKLNRKSTIKYFSNIYLVKTLYVWFRKTKPSIVNVQYLAPGFTAILAAKFAGIRVVVSTIHVSGHSFYGFKAKVLFRFSAWLCNNVISVSQSTEKFWFGNSLLFNHDLDIRAVKHFTIYNAVDCDKIETITSRTEKRSLFNKYHIPIEKANIGIVGRLAIQKGHEVLFRALHGLVKFNYNLLVIGKGPQNEYLNNLGIELGISKNIIWIDEVSQEEVFSLYSIMDLLVVPSLYEGFGLVAAEAMASGLPVIASDVDGLREIVINDQTGILVQPGSIKDLKNRILHYFSNKNLKEKYSIESRRVVKEKFSFQVYRDHSNQLYSSLSKL